MATSPPDRNRRDEDYRHQPVLVAEVVDTFAPVPPGWVVDGTLGGGGHALALLTAHPHLRVLGVDRDPVAVTVASARLAAFGDRARVVQARFDRFGQVLDEWGLHPLSGVLLDLGVSSPQIDWPERGFAYRFDGPLDMRMDTTQRLTAEVVVNEYSEEELVTLMRSNADVPRARAVARTIVRRRPLASTVDLRDAVHEVLPPHRVRKGDPAKLVFQAIRMEVNDELESLLDALDQAIDRLQPNGRLAVISYHRGEDRLVKERFRRAGSGGCECDPRLGCVCGAVPEGEALTRRAIMAGPDEVEANPRSASARMRVFQRAPRRAS